MKTKQNIHEIHESLFIDYLKLISKYKEKLNPSQFGYLLISFNAEMMLECAPDYQSALNIIDLAIDDMLEKHFINE